jgi:hypothetical protein
MFFQNVDKLGSVGQDWTLKTGRGQKKPAAIKSFINRLGKAR